MLYDYNMILIKHCPIYREIFQLSHFMRGPALTFGFQDIQKGAILNSEYYHNLPEFFAARGIDLCSLDLFDARAALRYDMNEPVPEVEYGRYATLIDIGSLEHVFDTRQCLDNCFRMVSLGGHYLLHVPINGYYEHGLHVFNPAGLIGAFKLNGFRIVYQKYTTAEGESVSDPAEGGDILLWLVGHKESQSAQFVCPQQDIWTNIYRSERISRRRSTADTLIVPRGPVELIIHFASNHSPGSYQCILLGSVRETVAIQSNETCIIDGIVTLRVTFDFSGMLPGTYTLVMRCDDGVQSSLQLLLPVRIPLRCWKKS
jgi:hypothetical protein